MSTKEQMNIVIVGHVDHGKSTFIGRLLADTKSLPEGKLEQVKATCAANAKPFEYAFLLDALKDEQSQGITIDAARCFFQTDKRHYIVIDAPGHIEFLKNMVTGAARAEAAVLLIDALEGVQENSRRHGYMLSLLGVKQVIVLVNKMDLVDYSESRYTEIVEEYTAFLKEINVEPKTFVPISAFNGDNLLTGSDKTPWYTGKSVLTHIDEFQKAKSLDEQAFRLPVQDIYKFTEDNDDRRIVAGTIETGQLSVGDEVAFLPSGKTSKVKSIEAFNVPPKSTAVSGEAIGVTLTEQIYIQRGDMMVKAEDNTVNMGTTFKANIFWLGKKPMLLDKKYKLKLSAMRAPVYLKEIVRVLDASNLTSQTNKQQINRHDVAECIFQTLKPIAFDLTTNAESTSRFVIVDDYEIAGGGIVTESVVETESRIDHLIEKRNTAWERGVIDGAQRANRYGQQPKMIMITGPDNTGKIKLAKALEKALFDSGKNVYYLGISNFLKDTKTKTVQFLDDREDFISYLGEIAHMFADSGQIVISTISDLQAYEAEMLEKLLAPYNLIKIGVGDTQLEASTNHYQLETPLDIESSVKRVKEFMIKEGILLEYSI